MLLKVLLKNRGVDFVNEDKIIEVNKLLLEGYSLNKLEKNNVLECSRKAFKNRAAKLNYNYNDEIKQFVKIDDINNITNSVTNNNTKVISRKSQEKIVKSKEKDLTLEALEERVKILEDLVLHNNTKVTLNNFSIELKKDIITRSIKVSKSVMKSFTDLAESKFNMYNKQDLLSKALLEFVEKYK